MDRCKPADLSSLHRHASDALAPQQIKAQDQEISEDTALKVKEAIEKSTKTGEGETVLMRSEGFNKENVSVSTFEFEWTLKVKD